MVARDTSRFRFRYASRSRKAYYQLFHLLVQFVLNAQNAALTHEESVYMGNSKRFEMCPFLVELRS